MDSHSPHPGLPLQAWEWVSSFVLFVFFVVKKGVFAVNLLD
jgi:hypothetical protein